MNINSARRQTQRPLPFMQGAIECVGLDLASRVIQAAWVGQNGASHNEQLKPHEFEEFMRLHSMAGAVFAMEACSGSQWVAGRIKSLGGRAVIIPAGACRSRSHGMKDDRNDAHGVLDALFELLACKDRAAFHPCIVRPLENQMDLDLLRCWDRRRSRLEAIKREVAAMLREKEPFAGISNSDPPQSVASRALLLASRLDSMDPRKLPNAAEYARMLRDECAEMAVLMKEINGMSRDFIAAYAPRHPGTCGLIQDRVRGAGPVLAASICIAVNNDFSQFKNPRALAAFTGVVPWHHGTGGKNRIGRMSKKGMPIVKASAYEASVARMRADGRLGDAGGAWDKRAVLKDMNLLVREICSAATGRADAIPARDRRTRIPQTISKFKSRARGRMRALASITRDPAIRDQLGKALRGQASWLVPSTSGLDPCESLASDAAGLNPVMEKAAGDTILAVMPDASGKGGK